MSPKLASIFYRLPRSFFFRLVRAIRTRPCMSSSCTHKCVFSVIHENEIHCEDIENMEYCQFGDKGKTFSLDSMRNEWTDSFSLQFSL